jgi:FkbM family methyltransferase
MVNSSLYHALFNIRHYGRRYGASKQFRVILHYSFIVLKKFFPNKRNPLTVNGYRIMVMPDDPGISQELQTFKTHEPLSTQLIARELKPGMTCLDIGSNIGYYVLLENKIIGDTGKVIAIEPSPYNFQCLKKNLEFPENSTVKTFNFAAGDIDGEIRFFVNERSNGCQVLNEGRKVPNRPGKIINVPIRTMDKFVEEQNLKNIDFVRMDVEGYEYNIFKGMSKTIEKFHPIVQIEVHLSHMGEEKTRKFFEFFKNHNYETTSFHHRALDLPMIGTKNDIYDFNIDRLLDMLQKKELPSYFNLIIKYSEHK